MAGSALLFFRACVMVWVRGMFVCLYVSACLFALFVCVGVNVSLFVILHVFMCMCLYDTRVYLSACVCVYMHEYLLVLSIANLLNKPSNSLPSSNLYRWFRTFNHILCIFHLNNFNNYSNPISFSIFEYMIEQSSVQVIALFMFTIRICFYLIINLHMASVINTNAVIHSLNCLSKLAFLYFNNQWKSVS